MQVFLLLEYTYCITIYETASSYWNSNIRMLEPSCNELYGDPGTQNRNFKL